MTVISIVEKQREERQTVTWLEEDRRLIGDGGYIPSEQQLLDDILIAAALNKNLLFIGPSGSGKTKLADTISAYFQQPMQSINCSVDLDAEALLGFKTIVQLDGKTIIDFIEGPVIQAMKKGHILYIDEINMAKPDTLSILNSVLDYRRTITNPFTGEVIVAHEHFLVIGAINEGYIGTSPMNEALANRFISFPIPYVQEDALLHLLQSKFPTVDEDLLKTFVKFSKDLMKQVENGLLSDEASSIRSLEDAIELAHYIDSKRAISYAISEKLRDVLERDLVNKLAATWMK